MIQAVIFDAYGTLLDIHAAKMFGFKVFWINRTGQPHEYGLGEGVTELHDLTTLPDALH